MLNALPRLIKTGATRLALEAFARSSRALSAAARLLGNSFNCRQEARLKRRRQREGEGRLEAGPRRPSVHDRQNLGDQFPDQLILVKSA